MYTIASKINSNEDKYIDYIVQSNLFKNKKIISEYIKIEKYLKNSELDLKNKNDTYELSYNDEIMFINDFFETPIDEEKFKEKLKKKNLLFNDKNEEEKIIRINYYQYKDILIKMNIDESIYQNKQENNNNNEVVVINSKTNILENYENVLIIIPITFKNKELKLLNNNISMLETEKEIEKITKTIFNEYIKKNEKPQTSMYKTKINNKEIYYLTINSDIKDLENKEIIKNIFND